MSTSGNAVLANFKQAGDALISSGEHVCEIRENKQDIQSCDMNNPYVVFLQSETKVAMDIQRLAIGDLGQEKQYTFNGRSLAVQLEEYYEKNKTKYLNKEFSDYAKEDLVDFQKLVKNFFESQQLPKELTELLIRTLTADAFFHRLGCVLPAAMFQHNRFLDNSTLSREIHIVFDPKLKEVNVYEQYHVQKTQDAANPSGPGKTSTLRTLNHLKVKLDTVTNKPTVSVEYHATAMGTDIPYAVTVIAAVTPQSQNPKVNENTVDYHVAELDLQIDENDQTALHRAVLNKDLNLVRILLQDKRIDMNKRDRNGKTALHCAAELNLEEMILLLVDTGVDCTIQDNKEKYAYEYATTESVKNFLSTLTLIDEYLQRKKKVESRSRLLDGLNLIGGYFHTDRAPLSQNKIKTTIVNSMRECLVINPSHHSVAPMERRNAGIAGMMHIQKKRIKNELQGHQHDRLATMFARFIMGVAEIFGLNLGKAQKRTMIAPKDGESHSAALYSQLSTTVNLTANLRMPRSKSTSSLTMSAEQNEITSSSTGKRVRSSPTLFGGKGDANLDLEKKMSKVQPITSSRMSTLKTPRRRGY